MSANRDYFLITDVGSTTTKAILIDNRSTNPVIGLSTQKPVEAPTMMSNWV
jgi:activator of 2-hydroxyglutaryl-CoA dehydratase